MSYNIAQKEGLLHTALWRILFYILTQGYVLERGRGWEWETDRDRDIDVERNIEWLPPIWALIGD